MNKTVIYAGTRNVYRNMETAAKSLLDHTKPEKIIFLTEDPEFPEPLPENIRCMDVSGQTFFPPDGANYHSRWTYMSLMRLALAELLPDENRVLWLDIDTVVIDDIARIFDTDLGDCCMAAVEEPARSATPFIYYNAGVLLMDLQKMSGGLCSELIRDVNQIPLRFPDQDIINLLCQTKIRKIHPVWNSCLWTGQPINSRIIHFAADRNYENRKLFQKYMQKDWGMIKNACTG